MRRISTFRRQARSLLSILCLCLSSSLVLALALSLSRSPFAGCLFSQREALLSALSNGERWQDVVSLVKAMLAKLLVVDNPTAGLAMKAYANLGLKEHWKSVGYTLAVLTCAILARVVVRRSESSRCFV